MLAAQLGLASEEGPSATVPRTGEVSPCGARSAGKGKKRKRGGSGVEGSAEEASDVPPSGEPQKKKKKKKKRTKKPVDEQSENHEEPTEIEEGDVQEEELQPEEEAFEAEISGERDDAAGAGEGEESEIPLNVARPDGSEDDSGESPLLIRRRNDEKKKRTKKPVDEQSENPEEPTEIEEGDVQEEELQPEEEASEAKISGEGNDAEEVGGGEESETPLNAARPDGSEEDIRESPLLIRRHNDEIIPRSDEVHVSPAARESSVRASELSVLNDRESDREA
ncbi:hypothetical protein DY000_02003663 [Brassica cretica]|uniref:Uncharacterized protein n=1 Tax=Brassica cretica TaxID=69181 RepID=A0ABQ7C5N7_BRACR|nr:hypothetical protein DY000_02003663 [Brassica cretica]